MIFCKRRFSPLQRHSLLQFSSLLILSVVMFMIAHDTAEHNSASKSFLLLLDLVPAIPIAAMILVVGRYLSRETDEFVRLLVTHSLLWGFGATMVTDIILAAFFDDHRALHFAVIFNMDVFCVVAMLAMRIQLWRNR